MRQRSLGGAQAVGDQPFGEAVGNQALHLLPDQLIAAESKLLLGLQIEQNDVALLVDHHHGVRRRFHQAAVPPLHLREMALCGLTDRYVADGGNEKDALATLQRAEHQFDGKFAAVLAPAGELDAHSDLLSQGVGCGARSVRDKPLGEAGRDEPDDVLPQQFVAAVSELLLGLEVEQGDVATLVEDHHRVRRRLKNLPIFGQQQARFENRGISRDGADASAHSLLHRFRVTSLSSCGCGRRAMSPGRPYGGVPRRGEARGSMPRGVAVAVSGPPTRLRRPPLACSRTKDGSKVDSRWRVFILSC